MAKLETISRIILGADDVFRLVSGQSVYVVDALSKRTEIFIDECVIGSIETIVQKAKPAVPVVPQPKPQAYVQSKALQDECMQKEEF